MSVELYRPKVLIRLQTDPSIDGCSLIALHVLFCSVAWRMSWRASTAPRVSLCESVPLSS